jgi:hypothetical protein
VRTNACEMSAGVSMASEQARFLFQDPNSLVTVWAIVSLILMMTLMLAVWGGLTRMPATRSRFLMLLVVGAVCAFLPMGALQVVEGVTIAVIVFLVVWGLVGMTPWGQRKLNVFGLRAQMRRGIETGYRLTPGRLSRQVERATEWFERSGFVRLTSGTQASGAMSSVLFRPEDGVIADVLRARTLRFWPSIVLTVRSYVFDHAGAFMTTSFGGNTDLAERQSVLVQVLPSASPDVLLARHVEGMRLLEARGVRFHRLDEETALELLEWGHQRGSSRLLEASDEELAGIFDRRLRAQAQRPRILQSMVEDPAVRRQIDAFIG